LLAAEKAIDHMARLPAASSEEGTLILIHELQNKWLDQKVTIEQRLLSADAQLQRLDRVDDSVSSGLIPWLKDIILGPG
jgi:hypothetical protein